MIKKKKGGQREKHEIPGHKWTRRCAAGALGMPRCLYVVCYVAVRLQSIIEIPKKPFARPAGRQHQETKNPLALKTIDRNHLFWSARLPSPYATYVHTHVGTAADLTRNYAGSWNKLRMRTFARYKLFPGHARTRRCAGAALGTQRRRRLHRASGYTAYCGPGSKHHQSPCW